MRKFLPLAILLAAGCAAPPPVPPQAAPAAVERQRPHETWEVVESHLEVRVYRDGPMARLGHNHLISSDAMSGVIRLREPRQDSGIELVLPLDSLVVDDPALRAAAGSDFADPVPEQDRDATRRNLLGPGVLDAARQPELRLTADAIAGGPGEYTAQLRVGLRGEERVIEVPLTVQQQDDRLRVHASLSLHHADLGLVPFSIALGALRVRDDIEIDCRLEARRAT